MMRRRECITLLGGAAAWPLVAHAQQPAVRTIGFLSGASGSDKEFEPMREYLAALRQGLAETSFVENQNLAIEYRWAENDYGRLPAAARYPPSSSTAALRERRPPKRPPKPYPSSIWLVPTR